MLSELRYSDRSFLVRAKQDADFYIDKIGFKDCKEREAVKKDLLQSGVQSSVHVSEVFSNPGKTCWRWICEQGLERSCPTCNSVVTFTTRKTYFDC